MFIAVLVLSALSVSAIPLNDFVPKNVVTVPSNCPDGQELINGECRDIWKSAVTTPIPPAILADNIYLKNVITVPPNCPPGQQLINGQCRDVWRSGSFDLEHSIPLNVVTVPSNCPAGQELVNGECRDIWKTNSLRESALSEILLQLIRAANAKTRQTEELNKILTAETSENDGLRNIISVPNQCPVGYRPDALGICRKFFE